MASLKGGTQKIMSVFQRVKGILYKICNNKATDIKVLSEDVISGEKVYVLEGDE